LGTKLTYLFITQLSVNKHELVKHQNASEMSEFLNQLNDHSSENAGWPKSIFDVN